MSVRSLFEWGDALRRQRDRRRTLRRRLGAVTLLIGAVGATIALPPAPRLVWNATASAPIGLYRVAPGGVPKRGDMVIANVPPTVRRLAAERRYIPLNVPLVKRVGAVPGDRVCALGTVITIDGRQVATRRIFDGRGRLMPWWTGCRLLREGGLFLLMADAPLSFDGRYFGISRSTDIVGTARPLWTR